jgi:hypothetical protein
LGNLDPFLGRVRLLPALECWEQIGVEPAGAASFCKTKFTASAAENFLQTF